jgi:PAS domain S-box-containing protein
MLKEEINKHKKTQLLLREAEEFNRSIIESSIDMIVAFDSDGNLQQYNHAFSVEFGLEPGKERELNVKKFLANDKTVGRVIKELQQRSYFSDEIEGKRLSGEIFSMFISVAVMRDGAGRALGAMAVGRDITDMKLAEAELVSSEERYRDILENATDIIFVVDSTGHFTYANPSFYKKLGFTKKTLSKTTIKGIIKNFPTENKDWINALNGIQEEREFIDSKGKELIVLGGGSAQYDDNGKAIGMRGIYLDISEMRHHEKEAKLQSAKLDSIFDSTQNLIMFTLNNDDQITSFNNNFRRLMEDKLVKNVKLGMSFISDISNLITDESYQGQIRLFKKALQGKAKDFELPLKIPSGEVKWFHIFLNPISSEEGQNEISCIAYDITERKQIDKAIRLALKEKEILLQEVHHRVKNNLQVISSLMSLQKSFLKDPTLIQVLEESQSRIATMSYIHESLYRHTDFSSISFAEYLQRLSTNLIHSYSTPDCDVTLQSSFEDVYLTLDQAIPSGLIVNELVSNALKYAFKGREKGVVLLRVAKKDNMIEIEVRDDGVGLPEDLNLKKNKSLGLYLIQALVEQLEAELVVESTKEGRKGSSFLISFEAQDLT